MATKDIPADVVLVRVAKRCCIGPQTTDVSKDDWKRAMASAEDAASTTDKFGYKRKPLVLPFHSRRSIDVYKTVPIQH